MSVDKKRFEAICAKGEEADKKLLNGQARDALQILTALREDLETKGDADSYLAARLTLSVLRCHLKLGDFKSAFRVWNANMEESLYGIGIYALESAQTTVRDMIAYDMICAFLHTLADHEKAAAGSAINQYLSRVCEYATEQGDRATMKLALNNWKQHLRDVFGGTLPLKSAEALIAFEKAFGEPVKPAAIDFPTPTAWEKPSDFREMSRVAEMRELPKSKKKRAS